jgi:hypothetical protein
MIYCIKRKEDDMRDGIRLWQEAGFPLLYVSQRILQGSPESLVAAAIRSLHSKLSKDIADILSDGRPYVVRIFPPNRHTIPDCPIGYGRPIAYGRPLDQYTLAAYIALQYTIDANIGEWVAYNDTGKEVVNGVRWALRLENEIRTFEVHTHYAQPDDSLVAWKRID